MLNRHSRNFIKGVQIQAVFDSKHLIQTIPGANISSIIKSPIHKRVLSKQIAYLRNQKVPPALKPNDDFIPRHIGNSPKHTEQILKSLKLESTEQLMAETVPKTIRLTKEQRYKHQGKELIGMHSETMMLQNIREIAFSNKVFKSYQGCGYYPTNLPSVIRRNVLENPNWYTPYTPYQAEIAQGRLESLLNFQTMVAELTGFEIANASLLDEATAAAEAMMVSYNTHNGKRNKFFVSKSIFPQTIDVIQTRADGIGIKLIIDEPANFNFDKADSYCGVIVQNPDNLGNAHDFSAFIDHLKKHKVTTTVIADILSLAIMKTPAEMGADMAVGSVQRFGVPMAYGGPHPGYIACTDAYKRRLPGRIIGVSKDVHGDKCYRMALQTREQHIRREKATSNICTAQALLANISAFYGQWYGPTGLKQIAVRVRFYAEILREELVKFGYSVVTQKDRHFDTITFDALASGFSSSDFVLAEFHKYGINLRRIDNRFVSLSFNETTNLSDLDEVLEIFADIRGKEVPAGVLEGSFYNEKSYQGMPKDLKRQSDFMRQAQFNEISSETQMMRYIQRLADKDIGLTNSMIPLGSCTLKLNSAISMLPITWHGFAGLHPFAPKDQVPGYLHMINELEKDLIAVTQYDAISLQPNSGANGEFAGLMAIKKYLESKGQGERNICLIPVSAHGTNPASAALCNMKVVAVDCNDQGDISVSDLKKKAEQYRKNLACVMITYPSTHGVYEEKVKEVVDFIHECGGQVYMDGANLNAQMGHTSPGYIGADVGHLNLHKTFSIPHGGGGPGIGPVGCKEHLKPFLPGHCVIPIDGRDSLAVSAAPYGSAGILPISYSYIKLMGKRGLLESSTQAILNANYLAESLVGPYKILYRGERGRVAHEFIIDLREFKHVDITESDIAKRLMDFGFHSATVSFPVPGSLMVEPTESEDKIELDRFIDAMKIIREEIREIEEGKADKVDNVLKNAPHTLKHLMSDTWNHSYSRQKACYPAEWIHVRGKKFPTVGRIDQTYGDRNLVCTCPPIEAFL